jgi:methylthioribulose-1-phosphate dehydratase
VAWAEELQSDRLAVASGRARNLSASMVISQPNAKVRARDGNDLVICATLVLRGFAGLEDTLMRTRKQAKKPVRGKRLVGFERPHVGFDALATELAAVGRGFYGRGWVLGTSGNFSAALAHEPMRLVITSTGLDKGTLAPEHFLEMDDGARVVRGDGKPSAEALLHVAIVRGLKAGAVLHTHSVWSTVLSGLHAAKGGVALEGYEMLKGLEGVRTHQHREWLPILENSQDMVALSGRVTQLLRESPGVHAFLLREHGLYTWGANLQEAKRHVEILEFLMEVVVRSGGGSRAI